MASLEMAEGRVSAYLDLRSDQELLLQTPHAAPQSNHRCENPLRPTRCDVHALEELRAGRRRSPAEQSIGARRSHLAEGAPPPGGP